MSQTFQLFRRVRYDDDASDAQLNEGLHRCCGHMLDSAIYRLRKTHPELTRVSSLRFDLVMVDDDQFQV